MAVSLWHSTTGEAKYELLSSECDGFFEARQALTKGKEYCEEIQRFFPRKDGYNAPFQFIQDGVLKALKFKIEPVSSSREEGVLVRLNRIFETRLELYIRGNFFAALAAMDSKIPVFVLAFIVDGNPQNLPLGYFCVSQRKGSTGHTWVLEQIGESSSLPGVPSSSDDRALQSSSDSDGALISSEAFSGGLGLKGASTDAPYGASRESVCPGNRLSSGPYTGASLRFSYGSLNFDSLLEGLHYFAFQKMNLPYVPSPGSFNIQGVTSLTGSQQRYQPDGLLHCQIFEEGGLNSVLVEIKPRPLLVEEEARAYAICKRFGQHVLCLAGDPVNDSVSGGADIDAERRHFCLEMSLFFSKGVSIEPMLYKGLMWKRTGGSFLLSWPAADPSQRITDVLQDIYRSAAEEARRAAGSSRCRVR